MIRTLRELIEQLRHGRETEQPAERAEAVRVATAALLVETARADFSERMVESAAVFGLLRRHFSLTAEEAEELMAMAEHELNDAVSLQHFTRRLHEELSAEEKLEIVEMLWRVAFADEVLHHHEDHVVRKIAGLLYVRDADVVRLRNRVRAAVRDGR